MGRIKICVVSIICILASVGNAYSQNSFTNSIGQKFVYIKPGTFKMGSFLGNSDEKPVHKVKLTRGFYMQTTEVTQEQWYKVMGTKPWSGKKFVMENRYNPAVYISWYDAKSFIKKLNSRGKKRYRLPTESEWEYACRAGSGTAYSFKGSMFKLNEYAWFNENALKVGEQYGHPVGTQKPNSWGLYDMHGNVWEWCEDRYAKNYLSHFKGPDPKGPASGKDRVFRGGSFYANHRYCRSAQRRSTKPNKSNEYIGFRLVSVSDKLGGPGKRASIQKNPEDG